MWMGMIWEWIARIGYPLQYIGDNVRDKRTENSLHECGHRWASKNAFYYLRFTVNALGNYSGILYLLYICCVLNGAHWKFYMNLFITGMFHIGHNANLCYTPQSLPAANTSWLGNSDLPLLLLLHRLNISLFNDNRCWGDRFRSLNLNDVFIIT